MTEQARQRHPLTGELIFRWRVTVRNGSPGSVVTWAKSEAAARDKIERITGGVVEDVAPAPSSIDERENRNG